MFVAPGEQDLVECGLAGAVCRDARTRPADVVVGGDQYDAVVREVWQGRPQHVVGTHGVDGECVHPRDDVGVLDVSEGDDGAGEHHGVEPAECVGRRIDDRPDGRGVGDVEFEREPVDCGCQFVQQVHATCGDGHLGAEGCRTRRDGMADARRGTDDEQTESGLFTTH
jgi:hypothetical protein